MAHTEYRETPAATSRLPSGIPYIVGNEAAERFSFYGMKAILAVFMTDYLLGPGGSPAPMSEADATSAVHLFISSAYFFPFLGAILSDAFLGKYRTILLLSIVYCCGHLALALDDTRTGLFVGLTLIAIGAGGIKPCVSAHVGDQFGKSNHHLLPRVFGWFYFAINIGAFASTLLTPVLLNGVPLAEMFPESWLLTFGLPDVIGGPWLAFGVPGVLMIAATFVFWLGRNRFVHIPAGGMNTIREVFSREGLVVIRNLSIIYAFVAVFWSLYDQTGSAWIFQAKHMDRHIAGREWLPSQIQAVNPILILTYIPLFSYLIYPAIDRVFPLTPLRKIGMGFFLTVIAFSISAGIEMRIEAGGRPNIGWQILAYAVLTAGEIMVSITCLEFSYTQSPNRMKSFVMSLFLLSIAAGNAFTSAVNAFIQNDDETTKLSGADYYWFFAGLMLVAAILFIGVAMKYRGRVYIQDELG